MSGFEYVKPLELREGDRIDLSPVINQVLDEGGRVDELDRITAESDYATVHSVSVNEEEGSPSRRVVRLATDQNDLWILDTFSVPRIAR